MTDITIDSRAETYHGRGAPHLEEKPNPWALWIFFGVLAVGLGYGLKSLTDDIDAAHEPIAFAVFILLGVALLIALGFEFVNGFHDTANAVATVIYTHSMQPMVAVIWSGCWNLLGVLVSTGAVAYSIITLLPVELILQVGSGAGYAMIFALGPDEYLVAGCDVQVIFSPRAAGPEIAGLASVEAGNFANGRWVPGRKLSGDDVLLNYDQAAATAAGQSGSGLRFGPEGPTLQRVKLYHYH